MNNGLIGALRVILGLDTAAFSKGAAKAQTDMQKMQAGMQKAGTAISGALAGILSLEFVNQIRNASKAGLDFAAGLGEQAQQLGVSTNALQEYRYAATQVGLEQSQMDQALSQLTKRLGAAAAGASGPTNALAALGLSARDAAGNVRGAGDAIPLIAQSLLSVGSAAERANIETQLFGKSGQQLEPLLSGGAKGVNEYRDAAHAAGVVISEIDINKADAIADKMAAINAEVTAQTAKLWSENAEGLLEFEISLAKLKIESISAFNTITSGFSDFNVYWDEHGRQFRAKWKAIGDVIANVAGGIVSNISNMANAIGAIIGTKLSNAFNNMKKMVTDAGHAFFKLYDDVVGNSWVPDMVTEVGQHIDRLDGNMVKPIQRQTAAATAAFAVMEERVGGILDNLFPEEARARGLLKDIADVETAFAQGAISLRDYNKAIEKLRENYGELDLPGRNDAETRLGAGEISDVSVLPPGFEQDLIKTLPEITEVAGASFETFLAQVENSARGVQNALADIERSVGGFVDSFKKGDIFGIILGLTDLIGKGSQIFANISGGGGGGSIPAFANGGSLILGGASGGDSNILSLNGSPIAKVHRGERADFTPRGAQRGGQNGQLVVRIEQDGNMTAYMTGIAGKVVESRAPAIVRSGAKAGMAAMLSHQRNRFA